MILDSELSVITALFGGSLNAVDWLAADLTVFTYPKGLRAPQWNLQGDVSLQ